MKKTTLVVMAAGMGSRFGGLKQAEPVTADGKGILDFSVYDAKAAGFDKAVFIVREDMEEDFKEFLPDYKNLDELKEHYQRGGLGDVKVKKFLNNVLQKQLEPIRQRRHEYEKDIPEVYHILQEGTKVAFAEAQQTLNEVKAAMKINYFDDADLIKVQSEKYSRAD